MRRHQWAFGLACLLLALSVAHAQSYSIIDLGTLGGTSSMANGINSRGQVVGVSATVSGQVHAFLWDEGLMTDLGVLPGLFFSEARTVSNTGLVAGDSTAAGGPPFHAVLWQKDGQIIALGVLPGGFASFAVGVNSVGQAVGASRIANRDVHAFLWQDGFMSDLGTLLLTDTQSVARAINDRGQIVGESSQFIGDPPPGPRHPVLWQDGAITDLGSLGGTSGNATAINSLGQVAGRSSLANGEVHGFIWENGTMTDLGTLGGNLSTADSVNNHGQVVGGSNIPAGVEHAFVWYRGVMTDLNGLIPADSGWVLSEATGINNAGEIVGFGTTNNQTHAFLLEPNVN